MSRAHPERRYMLAQARLVHCYALFTCEHVRSHTGSFVGSPPGCLCVCLLILPRKTCWLRVLVPLAFAASGLHYGEVFEQVALLQKRPDIPDDMPPEYAGGALVVLSLVPSWCGHLLPSICVAQLELHHMHAAALWCCVP